MKLTDRAKLLNEWLSWDDEFFEDKELVAQHYHLLKLMDQTYPVYVNPLHLHLLSEYYLMKDIRKMKCKGCCCCTPKRGFDLE